MAHIWVRAEQRAFEQRVGLTPQGARALLDAGHQITVEESPVRAIKIEAYAQVGCNVAPAHAWMGAPDNVIVFGLKELNEDGPDLRHKHIMFGHAYKGQSEGPALLQRFNRGGGTLYDLEYLTEEDGRRIAAFGYWAGYAGAAVGLMAWIAQQADHPLGAINVYDGIDALLKDLKARSRDITSAPNAIIIGARGRVGSGAADLCDAMGMPTTLWDIDETKNGGPFPEILEHDMFVNCILANPKVPVFVPQSAIKAKRKLSVIADVSCDPSSDYNPVPVYDHSTTFAEPLVNVTTSPTPLDVMAIDNLPSMLPVESSTDYAAQLLPHLATLDRIDDGVWGRAAKTFHHHASLVR